MKPIFGTDGIRGPVGLSPLALDSLPRLGEAIAWWAEHAFGTTPKILLAHDTRTSCSFIKSALKAGLLLKKVQIFDAGVLPTPATSMIMHHLPAFDCAIVISASHNHYSDNGIKIIDRKLGKISEDDELVIAQRFASPLQPTYTEFGSDEPFQNASQVYVRAIQSQFSTLSLQGITVVLDCAHGATSSIAPEIFASCGARVITLNAEPNGININNHCGSLYPQQLQEEVIRQNAQIGFAFDGDGDRVIAVNKYGVIKDGDDILALLSQHSAYKNSATITGTVMSNQGLEQHLARQGKKLARTAVGDKHVSEHLSTQNLLLGGEPSGHIILKDLNQTGDGIVAALRTLEVLSSTNAWDMKSYTKFPQVIRNIPYSIKKDLTSYPLKNFIKDAEKQVAQGRLLVRYSGTENVARIMVEAASQELAEHVCHSLAQQLTRELNP